MINDVVINVSTYEVKQCVTTKIVQVSITNHRLKIN